MSYDEKNISFTSYISLVYCAPHASSILFNAGETDLNHIATKRAA